METASVAPIQPSEPRPIDEEEQAVVQPVPVKSKQRFVEAAEACIVIHEGQRAWDAVTIRQVRTAVRLFDHACGGNVFIEDIAQEHVTVFTELRRALPNRSCLPSRERQPILRSCAP